MTTLPQADLYLALTIVISTILVTTAACALVALFDHGVRKRWWSD